MAQYRVTGPDGSIYDVTAPDDATPEQVQSMVAQSLGNAPAAQAPAQEPSLLSRVGRGVVRGVRDPIDAGAQMLVRGANAIGLAPQSEVDRVDQINRDAEQGYQQSRGASAGTFDPSRIGGQIVGTAPLFALAPAGGATLAGRTAMGAVTGAGMGALVEPVDTSKGDFWQQKLGQAKSGAIAGAVAAPVTAALSRVIQPKTAPDVKTLMREGVTPTPGQILGGGWRSAEEKAKSIPLLGSSIRNAEQRSAEQFNRAAIDRSLAPIGQKLPKGVTGHEAIEFANDQLSKAYDDVITKIGSIAPDQQLGQEITNLGSMVGTLPKERGDQFLRIIKSEIADRIDQYGRVTGEGFKAADQNLGKLAAQYMRSTDADQQTLGRALSAAHDSLRSWLTRVAPPEASDALKAANAGWANFKRVQRAASSVAAEDGLFSAAQLHGAVRALDRSKDKGGFAKGTALMQDLSAAGKNTLANKVPNSGTTDRLLATLGVLGPAAGATVSPWLAAGALPAVAYTKAGQAMLGGLLARRPALAEPLSKGVSLLGTPVLTAGLLGLTKD